MFIESLKKSNWKCCTLMCIGNLLIGIGVAVFKISGLGNDPFNGMSMAVSGLAGISYANIMVMFNVFLFLVEFIFGKKYIGLGTVVNGLLIGYIASFSYEFFVGYLGKPSGMAEKMLIMCCGVIVMSLGISMYQMPEIGVAPYDSLSLMMAERMKKIPYLWCRIFTDALCVVICWICGGLVGIGTVVSAFGLGTVVQFFNTHVTGKILEHIKPGA